MGSSILCYVAVSEVGGFSGLHNSLKDIDPGMVNLFPRLTFGVTCASGRSSSADWAWQVSPRWSRG